MLVLFVIMMLNSHEEEKALARRPIQRWGSVILVAALAFGAVRLVQSSPGLKALGVSGAAMPPAMSLQTVGATLFADHLLGFEVAGLLLLAAMIGAVALTKRNL
ncbi:MAG: NADH-ubiquinone/plastoquinone oxidoreductase chain 6 [Holophagaceae bacterium]|nr:NADH-ubiquinone/plastoquinone oxidoreductase chain 6 [Holophagaceae bacterium]